MAWWDAQHNGLGSSPRSKPRLTMGDAFPRLEPTHIDKHSEMERERALLSPVFEEQLGPPTTPALVVHVDIRFTDPVIRSRYCRSYGSSPEFDVTNRTCRGLVRRIERCAEEFITRKDSGALEVFKGDTYERKPQRFEMTFRVMRRGKGEWAERTYRSYQKQPLTVALTREITLAAHRMIGLFLRRHDQNFRWLDCPAPETDSQGSETTVPSRDGPLSLLSIPRSRFIEATQTFEFVPGYSIELCFRSRNPQREVPTFERRIKVNSAQTTPLTLFMSEDMLWKALHFVNLGLDSKKRDFDEHIRDHRVLEPPHSEDDTLEVELKVSNNLGPVYSHVQRNLKSKLALFRDPDAKDCDDFLCDIKRHLSNTTDEADSTLNAMDDLELRIVELKGVGWTLREPAKFTLGPAASYGRRTIQAALDRIQTGVGDVIRGHNIAIHINAHKRGHLVLDKAIVAHEKRGKPKETFPSHEDAQAAFVARLKARVQKDIDKVFEDSCSIDDIPEDEEDYFARPVTPVTPVQPEQAVFDGPSPRFSPSSVRSSPAKPRPALSTLQGGSPRPRAQRVFSLSRRSTESVRSIDYLKTARDLFAEGGSRPGSAVSEQAAIEPRLVASPLPQGRGPLLAAAEVRPARSFSLVSNRSSSAIRVSNASTLVEEQAVSGENEGQNHRDTEDAQKRSVESHGPEAMTSNEEAATPAAAPSRELPGGAVPGASLASHPAVQQREVSPQVADNRDAPSALLKSKQSKMDTPEFVDAREYASSPAAQELAKAELAGALAGVESPRDDDAYSTAPSTPELSTGASSPRQSILITPVYLRTDSGAKEPAFRSFYPASEPEQEASDLQGERESAAAAPDSKEDRDHLATDASPSGQPCLNPLPSPITTSSLAAGDASPGIAPGDADSECASGGPDPATRVVSLAETPDTQPAPTPRPPTASPEANATDPNKAAAASESPDVYTAADLGAELTAGSEEPPAAASDFPTPQVRATSDTNNTQDAAGHHSPVLDDAPSTPEPAVTINAQSTLAPEDPDSGRDLGAETTEPAVVEDSVRGGVPDDVAAGAPLPPSAERCGAEWEHDAVPPLPSSSWAAVAAEAVELGTEIELETGEAVPKGGGDGGEGCDGGRGVGRGGAGAGPGFVAEELPAVTSPDAGPVEEIVGVRHNDDTDVPVPESVTAEGSEDRTGPGLITEQEKEQPATDAVTSQDLGPADEAIDACQSDDVGVRAPETTTEECSEETTGSGADSEAAQAEPENAPTVSAKTSSPDLSEDPIATPLSDKVADSADADHAPNETSAEPEEGSSDPGAGAEQAEHPAPGPELQVDGGPAPAPTALGDAESLGPHLDEDTVADGAESRGASPENAALSPLGDSTAAADGSESPGEHAGDEPPRAVDQELVPDVPADVPEVDGETVTEVTSVAEAETPKLDAGDVERETLTVPAGPETAETEALEGDVEDGDKEGSDTVPAAADATGAAEETVAALAADATGTEISEHDAADEGKGSTTLPTVAGDVLDGDDVNPAGAETEVASSAAKGDVGDKAEVPVDGASKDIHIPEEEIPGPEIVEEQPVEADGQSQRLAEDVAADEEAGPLEAVGQDPQELDIQTDAIGGEDAFDSDKEQLHADAGVGNDADAPSRTLGSELGIEKAGAAPADEGGKLDANSDVCAEPGIPGPQYSEKHIAPTISVDDLTDLTNLEPAISALPTDEPTKPDPAGTTTLPEESAAGEAPPPKPTPSLPARPEKAKAKPQLALIPDLSKLSAPSFTTSTPRDSVDTIRPSIDETPQHPPTLPTPEQRHAATTTGRPKTAGYLNLGLRESRFIEVGLRGALGDVKSRRLSLPLQQHLLLDTEEGDRASRPPAPASDAGGGVKGSRLLKKKKPVVMGEHSNGWDDEQAAVLPRMMMMLAGAVALGKIMKRAAEGD